MPKWAQVIIAEGAEKNKSDLNVFIKTVTCWMMEILAILLEDYNCKEFKK